LTVPFAIVSSPGCVDQIRIVREDGVLGLFRGGGPTVVRAMALNMGMLASNDQAKEMIEQAGFPKGGSTAVLGGATIAGAFSIGNWRFALQMLCSDAGSCCPHGCYPTLIGL
jgi:hypothetical protein